jgi:hypothetical protein
MPIYMFHRKGGAQPVNCSNDAEAILAAKVNPDVIGLEFAPSGKIIWEETKQPKFSLGEDVFKPRGYSFRGKVVSVFKNLSGDWRVVVEMTTENGLGILHIYNETQLEPV